LIVVRENINSHEITSFARSPPILAPHTASSRHWKSRDWAS